MIFLLKIRNCLLVILYCNVNRLNQFRALEMARNKHIGLSLIDSNVFVGGRAIFFPNFNSLTFIIRIPIEYLDADREG